MAPSVRKHSAGKRHKRSRTLDYLVYIVIRLLIAIFSRLPCWLLYPAMGLLGRIFFRLHGPLRRTALANVHQAFGKDSSPAEIERLARASLVHFFRIIADFIKAPRLLFGKHLERAIQFEGFSMLDRFRGSETGLLFLTGHLGSFETAGMVWNSGGYPVHVVSRPVDNPYLDRWLWGTRHGQGEQKILRQGAIPEVIRLLRKGENVAMLVDQNQRKRPIFVPFFGRLAATVRSPALIALRLQMPVVLACAMRIGKGFRFQAECLEVIEPPTEGTMEEQVYAMTLAIQQGLERVIRRAPEQYFWLHNRWKTRPPSESLEPLSDPDYEIPAQRKTAGESPVPMPSSRVD